MPAAVEVAVGAIAVRDRTLLLVKRGHPPEEKRWSLPGGRVEPGETLRDAAVREVAEETGLSVCCGDLVGWVERISESHHFVIFDFAVSVLEDETPVAGDDAEEVRWVPLLEVKRLDLASGLGTFLSDHRITP